MDGKVTNSTANRCRCGGCIQCHFDRSLRLLLNQPKVTFIVAATIAIRMLLGPGFRHYRNRQRSLLRRLFRPNEIVFSGLGNRHVCRSYEPDVSPQISDFADPQPVCYPNRSILFGRDDEQYIRELSTQSSYLAIFLLFFVMLCMYFHLTRLELPLPTPHQPQIAIPRPEVEPQSTILYTSVGNISRGGF